MNSNRGFHLLIDLLMGCSPAELETIRSLIDEGSTVPTYWVKRLIGEVMDSQQGTDAYLQLEGAMNDLLSISRGEYPVHAITPERLDT